MTDARHTRSEQGIKATPFWCHEHDRACAGWAAMRFPKGQEVAAPWPHLPGRDVPDA
jgi:hypothetical protein